MRSRGLLGILGMFAGVVDGSARARSRLSGLASPARVAAVARSGLKFGGVVLIASAALAGATFAAASLYNQFGGGRALADARSWAQRTPVFERAVCQGCHRLISTPQLAGVHARVSCEACHGALGGHPGTGGAGSEALIATPDSGICVTCHAATLGRPAGFPQVDLAAHYAGAACLRCHDPHTVAAVAPPEVTHPLANLPACTTCHAPDGLKKVPAGHEVAADSICLTCHSTVGGKPRQSPP